MEQLKSLLQVSSERRADIVRSDQDEIDRRHRERKAMIANRRARREQPSFDQDIEIA